jgi:hypothetical protein
MVECTERTRTRPVTNTRPRPAPGDRVQHGWAEFHYVRCERFLWRRIPSTLVANSRGRSMGVPRQGDMDVRSTSSDTVEAYLGLDRSARVVALNQVEALVRGGESANLVKEKDVVLVSADSAG